MLKDTEIIAMKKLSICNYPLFFKIF